MATLFQCFTSRGWTALSAALAMGIALSGCAGTAPIKAQTVQSGTLRCFDKDSTLAPGKPATCELSAVANTGKALVFANDKPMPGKQSSPVFSIPFDGGQFAPNGQRTYFLQPPFVNAQKYEAMAATPDGKWVFAATAFDRHGGDKPDLDRYNTLLAWPAAQPGQVSVLASSERQGIVSSASLRGKFASALKAGNGYFKIEGLAAIPGNWLLFGVRETGSFKDPVYTIKLVKVGYQEVNGQISLLDDFTVVYEFTPPPAGIPHKLGLSSLEYDSFNGRLYLLTSFEESDKADGIGAYLWVLPMDDLDTQKAPGLVYGMDAQPLMFTHKAEGLAVLDKDRVLLVHDDDRIITKLKADGEAQARDRSLNESAFDVLKWH